MNLRLLSCLVPSLLAAACGSLPEDPSAPEALATLEGELTNQGAVPLEGNVRIAVIWRRGTPGEGVTFSVAEDVPVEPVFPSKFRVVLRNPPPEEAMFPAGDVFPDDDGGGPGGGNPEPYPLPTPADPTNPSGREPAALAGAPGAKLAALPSDLRAAAGTLVAYVDDNGNGRLDLVDEGAPGFVDRVVATNDGLLLSYFEGTIPSPFPGFEAPPAPGYNFLVDTCTGQDVPVSSDDPAPRGGQACAGLRAFGPAEPFTLPVTADPGLNDLMCKNGGRPDSGSSGGFAGLPPASEQPASYPAANDPNLRCAPDGASYYVEVCETFSEGLCKGVTTNCAVTEGYRRPDPAPAAWPCPSSP